MPQLIRTTSAHEGFQNLVIQLNRYLHEKDGDEHAFYAQFNKSDSLSEVVVLEENGVAVACGALRKFDGERVEVKRMFSEPEMRGRGYAGMVLKELEKWAAELGFRECILETGNRQTEAVGFYHKSGYTIIPNFGPYIGVDNSICFSKQLV